MRIFMYVLKDDLGFAPNPFHGWCTLACCKPAIRSSAHPGDWVVGITPRGQGNDVAYAMKVEQTLSFEEYWADRRFRAKRPRWSSHSILEQRGDNCYEWTGNGEFRPLPSMHWKHEGNRKDQERKARDLGGKRVLVARRFSYFGENAEALPSTISVQLPGRFNRVNFTEGEKAALLKFLEGLPRGIRGRPRDWKPDDGTWRQRRSQCG